MSKSSRYYAIRHLESALVDLDNSHSQVYACLKMFQDGDYPEQVQFLQDWDTGLFRLRELLHQFMITL
jgi:hypothetical protein